MTIKGWTTQALLFASLRAIAVLSICFVVIALTIEGMIWLFE